MCYKLLLAQRTELIQLNSIREKFGTGSQLITSVTNTRRQKFTINFQSLHNLWKKNTTKRRKLKLKSKKKGKGIPRQADVALGVPGRLRPRIFPTFGTTMVVGRQPNAPAAFTLGEIPGTHFQRLSRAHGFVGRNHGKNPK